MAKKAKSKSKNSRKKAPSEAQLKARAAFAAGEKGKSGAKKTRKPSKKSANHGRMDEPRTAASARFKDDASSTYERAAVVPVSVPKPEALPDSAVPVIPERKPGAGSFGQALNPKPFSGKPKKQSESSTAFYI